MYKVHVNAVICILFVGFMCMYTLQRKKVYPRMIIETLYEPIGKFISYIFVYILATYNPLLGILFALCIVNIHIDIITYIVRMKHLKHKNKA